MSLYYRSKLVPGSSAIPDGGAVGAAEESIINISWESTSSHTYKVKPAYDFKLALNVVFSQGFDDSCATRQSMILFTSIKL